MVGFILAFGVALALEDNCTAEKRLAVCKEEAVKERVEWACGVIEKKGKDGVPEVNAMRYDCCGEPNYVWINDFTPKMVDHPMKKEMNGKDISKEKDADGKLLFVEFVKVVKKTPAGGFFEYKWQKFGTKEPSPKKSWIKACKVGNTDEKWVVGSGTWK